MHKTTQTNHSNFNRVHGKTNKETNTDKQKTITRTRKTQIPSLPPPPPPPSKKKTRNKRHHHNQQLQQNRQAIHEKIKPKAMKTHSHTHTHNNNKNNKSQTTTNIAPKKTDSHIHTHKHMRNYKYQRSNKRVTTLEATAVTNKVTRTIIFIPKKNTIIIMVLKVIRNTKTQVL